MSELDFGLLRPAPDLSAGFIQSYEAGRQMGRQRRADNALAALQQDPNNPQAQNELAVYAPQDYANVVATQDRARAGQARQAAGNVVAQYGAPWGNTVPQPSAPGPMAPQAPIAAPQAAVGTMQAPAQPPAPGGAPAAPQSPGMSPGMVAPPAPMTPQAIQASPLTNPAHPEAIAVGQQASQGGLDPSQAWAALYRLDPEMGDHLVKSLQGMDTLRVSRLSEMEGAMGEAAQRLLKAPMEQRRALAMSMMPQLAAHGVTPQMVAQADLSDEGLHGIIGQGLGLQGAIAQHNTEVTQGLDQQRVGLQRDQLTEQVRHNKVEEQKGVSVAFGTDIVNPITGATIHDGYSTGGDAGGAPTALPDIAARIVQVEGQGNNPKSSASGAGQMINSTFVNTFRQTFPDKAAGMSNAQILAQRGTGVEPQMMQTLTASNAATLERAGLPPTAANVYALHFLGPGDGIKVLRANPTQSLADLVSPGVISANPFLRGMTVERLQQWTADKMGGGGGSGGARGNAMESQAKLIATYQQAPPTGRAAMSPQGQLIMQMVQQQNPTYDGTRFNERKAAAVAWGSGKLGTLLRSQNVAFDHIGTLQAAAQALQNGDTPIFNRVSNAIATMTGKAPPGNFDALRNFVADEVTKGIIGAAGGVGDREAAAAAIHSAQSPQQLAGILYGWKHLLAGQIKGLEQQYTDNTGLGVDTFVARLSPRTRAEMGYDKPAQGGAPVKVASPEQAASLPSGTLFQTPDGRVIRKH